MLVGFDTIVVLMPELVLVFMAVWIYVVGTTKIKQSREAWALVAVAGYAVAGVVLYWQFVSEIEIDGPARPLWEAFLLGQSKSVGPLAVDFLAGSLRWLALVLGVIFTLIFSRIASRDAVSEVFGTLMLLVAGLMLVAAARDLILLFVSLELISIPTYVLLFLGRRDRASSEAAAKYFFLSIFASAILLYGFSFLYGVTGTTNLSAIDLSGQAQSAPGGATSNLLFSAIAAVLIFAGLGFKLAAVPFHFYAPDVYQGTTNANAGVLAVAPKIAGVLALVRLTVVFEPLIADYAWQVAIVLSVLTMTVGNVCALWQKNVRRLLAYSSIAHAGYMLIGLAVALAAPDSSGIAALLFYLLVYTFAALGTFAALSFLGREDQDVSRLDEIAGLGRRQSVAAGVIAVCMFSLAGIPPLAGFWGKFSLFGSAIGLATQTDDPRLAFWFTMLAVIGAVNAAIAAAYYLRVVGVMYFRAPIVHVPAQGGQLARVAMMACAFLVVLIGFVPGQAMNFAELAEMPVRNATSETGPEIRGAAADREK